MDVTTVAAIIYLFITAGVVAFQFALAFGVPWGSYAMGGKFPGRFPPAMRASAVGQAALLGLMAAVVMSRAGLLLPDWAQVSVWLTWVIVAFSVVSVVLNTITPSAGERRVWLPVALVMLASSLTVALTAG
jgi:phosphatidylglycerophosphate synthase